MSHNNAAYLGNIPQSFAQCNYLRQRDTVYPAFVCLSVCLLRITADCICMKILPKM